MNSPTPTTEALIAEFLASLGPKERIVHTLAAAADSKLGSRYCPHRSNAYLAFLKKRQGPIAIKSSGS